MQRVLLDPQTFVLFYLLYTGGQWFCVGVRWNVWVCVSPVLFTLRLVWKPALFFNRERSKHSSLEILEGPLFTESEENDLANPPIAKSFAT